jgi:acyl carrier protein
MKSTSHLWPALVCAAVCTGCLTSDKPLIDDASADHPFQMRTLVEIYKWDYSAKVLAPGSRQLIERSAGGYVLLPTSTPELARLKRYAENLYVAETQQGIGVLEAGSDGFYRVYQDFGERDCAILPSDLGRRSHSSLDEGTCRVANYEALLTVLGAANLAKHHPNLVFRVVQATDDGGTNFDLCLPRDVVEQRIRQIASEQLNVGASELSSGKSLLELSPDELDVVEFVFALEDWFSIALPDEPTPDKKSSKRKPGSGKDDFWTIEKLTDRVRKATGCRP